MLIELFAGFIFTPILLPHLLNLVRYVSSTYLVVLKPYMKNSQVNNKSAKVLTYIHYQLTRIKILMRVLLGLLWWHAWIIIQLIKVAELAFRLLLRMPNCVFDMINLVENVIYTTQNEPIQIFNVFDENGDITNKFKLFLKLYWEKGNLEKEFNQNSFSIEKYRSLFCSSILFFTYKIGDKMKQKFMSNLDGEKRLWLDEAVEFFTEEERQILSEMDLQKLMGNLAANVSSSNSNSNSNEHDDYSDYTDYSEVIPQLLQHI